MEEKPPDGSYGKLFYFQQSDSSKKHYTMHTINIYVVTDIFIVIHSSSIVTENNSRCGFSINSAVLYLAQSLIMINILPLILSVMMLFILSVLIPKTQQCYSLCI